MIALPSHRYEVIPTEVCLGGVWFSRGDVVETVPLGQPLDRLIRAGILRRCVNMSPNAPTEPPEQHPG